MAVILQPFYIYDPNVGDDLGGLKVHDGDDGRHVLASPQMAQYWMDQGLLGREPVSKLSGAAKSLLKQITRGRSEDNESTPKRVPKYNKKIQSGKPAMVVMKQRQKKRQQERKQDDKPPHKPEPKAA